VPECISSGSLSDERLYPFWPTFRLAFIKELFRLSERNQELLVQLKEDSKIDIESEVEEMAKGKVQTAKDIMLILIQ